MAGPCEPSSFQVRNSQNVTLTPGYLRSNARRRAGSSSAVKRSLPAARMGTTFSSAMVISYRIVVVSRSAWPTSQVARRLNHAVFLRGMLIKSVLNPAPATNFLTRLMTASDPELPINPLRGGHSDCAKGTVPRRTGQADLRQEASPGTGSATLRQKAEKRGSPL